MRSGWVDAEWKEEREAELISISATGDLSWRLLSRPWIRSSVGLWGINKPWRRTVFSANNSGSEACWFSGRVSMGRVIYTGVGEKRLIL